MQEDFKRAFDSINPEALAKLDTAGKLGLYDTFVTGVRMTRDIMTNTLSKYGVVECKPLGEKFDPYQHEAIFEYKDPKIPSGTIGQLVSCGYKIGKRVLRAAKVGVVKNPKA